MTIQDYASQNIIAVDHSFYGVGSSKIIEMILVANCKIQLRFTEEFLQKFELLIRKDDKLLE